MTERLGAKLAEGACAEVFAWGEDDARIVKLAKPNTNLFALTRESQNCEIAWRLGLRVPRPYGLVEIDGRNGIVFERVEGRSILQSFAERALAGTASADPLEARLTARLLHRIHSHSADDLPAQYPSLERDIRRGVHLDAAEKDAVMARLAQLPARRQACHGDPNPGNFLLDGDDAIVIDWNNASLGNPEADLAEYVLMLRHARLPDGTPPAVMALFAAVREPSIALFIAEYERLSGLGAKDIEPWLTPIAARKLAVDGITAGEKDSLVAEVRRRLAAG